MGIQTSFFDSRRTGQLVGHFPSLCTIQQYTQSVDAGYEAVYEWAAITALTDIPCSVAFASGREVKGDENQYGISTHRISLAGVYSAILRGNRAVIDGVNYDINTINQPGFTNSVTVLDCTVVNSGAQKDIEEISHSAVFGEAVFGYSVFGETE